MQTVLWSKICVATISSQLTNSEINTQLTTQNFRTDNSTESAVKRQRCIESSM